MRHHRHAQVLLERTTNSLLVRPERFRRNLAHRHLVVDARSEPDPKSLQSTVHVCTSPASAAPSCRTPGWIRTSGLGLRRAARFRCATRAWWRAWCGRRDSSSLSARQPGYGRPTSPSVARPLGVAERSRTAVAGATVQRSTVELQPQCPYLDSNQDRRLNRPLGCHYPTPIGSADRARTRNVSCLNGRRLSHSSTAPCERHERALRAPGWDRTSAIRRVEAVLSP